ncbi:hypothetical protein [Cohnella faecalis]|uniref:Uncharacterized protein n=1 Tax=Cohnella faecalis TaxID=2315694 RepID=A0A398CPJ2_9BACL|nr:hypothetical protein [Cohnella faecalis]RIE04435.1 hypothetical protein D3H35_07575 [Cohnella faecalis]
MKPIDFFGTVSGSLLPYEATATKTDRDIVAATSSDQQRGDLPSCMDEKGAHKGTFIHQTEGGDELIGA